MTKKKETIFVFSQHHYTDGHCETEPVRMVNKEVFEKAMKKMDEDLEKNYTKDKGGGYVHK